MLPLIIAGLVAIGGLILANSDDEKKGELSFSKDSDCSNEFLTFSESISIISSKKKQLINARKVLQQKIKEYFAIKSNTLTPTFYIQGSYKHGTIIRKQDDTCDIDVGIYFGKKPTITPLALHNNVVAAVGQHTNEKATVKNKCVRIYYANQFHIDIPVYYKEGNKYYIGTGNAGWKEDDPKLFTNWLKENISDDSQKLRVIKYFKAWADCTKNKLGQKMPSGLSLTIWVIKHFEGDGREDLAFLKSAISLKNYLSSVSKDKWECIMPTTPGDNVIDKLTEEQRGNFLNALNNLVDQSIKLTSSSSKEECLSFWKSTFGKWF